MGKPLTAVQRAFLAGARYGRRRAAATTRHDVEDLMDELDEARTTLAAARGERATEADSDSEPDPDTRVN